MKLTKLKLTYLMFVTGGLLFQPLMLTACDDDEITRPEVVEPLMPELAPEGELPINLEQTMKSAVAFNAGEGSHSYRIPSVVTAKDGSLLLFCEARHQTWQDKSYTDVVVKRSVDGGLHWSEMKNLTGTQNGGAYAYMDPTPVVDEKTGKIFLFCTRWNKSNSDTSNNRAFLLTSSDNGQSWDAPKDVTDMVILKDFYSAGFGPGAGVQLKNGAYAGRMILTSRQHNVDQGSKGISIYSDDQGRTWKQSMPAQAGESQIAECSNGQLSMNIRRGSDRYASISKDGGVSWSPALRVADLPSLESGCQASVLGADKNILLYCGPMGGVKTNEFDNRSKLTLYRSPMNGELWTRHKTLYPNASGYSDMTFLPDGRLVIVFEAGPDVGFMRNPNRGKGWMRIDVIILPKEVSNYDYWFE